MSTPFPQWDRGREVRIGDAEREAAVTALGEHYAAGRLTKVEYDERADLAWAARTHSALWPLFADLPRPEPVRAGPVPRERPPVSGWWFGARWVPVLAVIGALALIGNVPWLVLLLVGWLMWVRLLRHWGRNSHDRRRGYRG